MSKPEAWRTAPGVRAQPCETNAALAERDYDVECKRSTYPIIVHEGYWIWWCEAHHQPLPWCEKARLIDALESVELMTSDFPGLEDIAHVAQKGIKSVGGGS
jgi:hypothetical protein